MAPPHYHKPSWCDVSSPLAGSVIRRLEHALSLLDRLHFGHRRLTWRELLSGFSLDRRLIAMACEVLEG